MKDIKSKDRQLKIKREIEELFFKPVIVSIDDIDKFERKEMKKIRPIKNTWYDWLIRKSVGGFKDKIVSIFKTNAETNSVRERKETKQTKNKKLKFLLY